MSSDNLSPSKGPELPLRSEHNLDAVVLFVTENAIPMGGVIQAQAMRDHKRRVNVALLDARQQWT